MFDINAKIVCVDDRFPSPYIRSRFGALPVIGRTYTVRDIVPGIEPGGNQTAAVLLQEIVSPPNEHGIEPGFAPWRFVEAEELAEAQAREAVTVGTYTASVDTTRAITA